MDGPKPRSLRPKFEAIPRDIDILVSHSPPFRVLDTTHISSREYLGSEELRDQLGRICPRVVVCGHIHGGYGTAEVYDRTKVKVYNVAQMNELYNPVNPPVMIQIVELAHVKGI